MIRGEPTPADLARAKAVNAAADAERESIATLVEAMPAGATREQIVTAIRARRGILYDQRVAP